MKFHSIQYWKIKKNKNLTTFVFACFQKLIRMLNANRLLLHWAWTLHKVKHDEHLVLFILFFFFFEKKNKIKTTASDTQHTHTPFYFSWTHTSTAKIKRGGENSDFFSRGTTAPERNIKKNLVFEIKRKIRAERHKLIDIWESALHFCDFELPTFYFFFWLRKKKTPKRKGKGFFSLWRLPPSPKSISLLLPSSLRFLPVFFFSIFFTRTGAR